jgi:putative transposase
MECTSDQKRAVILGLAHDEPSITTLCDLLGLARSTFYYRGTPDDDQPLKAALLQLAGAWPTYGYRRLTALLHRQGHTVNTKRVRRLMGEMGIQGKAPVRRRRTTNSDHAFPRYPNRVEGLEVIRPDQVWVADITYIRLKNEFVYLSVLMDVFTRCIRGWHLGRGLDQDLTLITLQRALESRRPEIHHSDQGVQYAATAYVELLELAGVSISMASVGEPTENGYAERLMRTIKEEEVDLSDYQDFADALRNLDKFLNDVYNLKRIHSSLGYLTPAEFEQQWLSRPRAG